MKGLANRHSLSRHKKTCQAKPFQIIGHKRSRRDDGTAEALSTNPKIQALADAIINDDEMDYSNKLPAVDVFPTNEKKLPTPPSEIVDKVFRKETLPSPPREVVSGVFKLPRTKKDLIGYSDDSDGSLADNDEKATDNSSDSDSCSSTEDKESNDNSSSMTKEEIIDNYSDVELPVKFLPKSIKGLQKRFNTRFVEFTRHGKHEHRNELVALLDEMLRRKVIERDEYTRLNNLIASSLTTGE